MKFQLEQYGQLNAITAQSDGVVQINGTNFEHSVIICPQGAVLEWSVKDIAQLTEQDLQPVVDQAPAVVLLGTGRKQVFPPSSALKAAAQAQVGVEVMTTAAAARTYNVLLSEGRQVIAALVVE